MTVNNLSFPVKERQGKIMKKIFIDPGHGDQGGDFGAIALDGTREADITLDIAQILKKLLSKKYQVYLSRERKMSDFPIYNNNLVFFSFYICKLLY